METWKFHWAKIVNYVITFKISYIFDHQYSYESVP